MALLSDEASLDEIVKLVGMDALSPGDRLKMEAARSIREDFLHQLAFHEVDTYTSLNKQYHMMKLVINYYDLSLKALDDGASIDDVVAIPVREAIGRFKYITEENVNAEYDKIMSELNSELKLAVARKEDY